MRYRDEGVWSDTGSVSDAELRGRVARCTYCKAERPSDGPDTLPFFEYHPDQPHDTYYCGCRGWD